MKIFYQPIINGNLAVKIAAIWEDAPENQTVFDSLEEAIRAALEYANDDGYGDLDRIKDLKIIKISEEEMDYDPSLVEKMRIKMFGK